MASADICTIPTPSTNLKLERRVQRKKVEEAIDDEVKVAASPLLSSDDPYNVPLLWLDTFIPASHRKQKVVDWFANKKEGGPGIRVKYFCSYKTCPGAGGPGGRCDALFFMHKDDVKSFAIPRFTRYRDMKWLSDMLANSPKIYCEELFFVDQYAESFDQLIRLKARAAPTDEEAKKMQPPYFVFTNVDYSDVMEAENAELPSEDEGENDKSLSKEGSDSE